MQSSDAHQLAKVRIEHLTVRINSLEVCHMPPLYKIDKNASRTLEKQIVIVLYLPVFPRIKLKKRTKP